MRHNFHHYKAANITFTPYEISFKLCHFTLLERFPHMISKIFSRVRQIIICGQIKIFQVPSQVWSSWFTAQSCYGTQNYWNCWTGHRSEKRCNIVIINMFMKLNLNTNTWTIFTKSRFLNYANSFAYYNHLTMLKPA